MSHDAWKDREKAAEDSFFEKENQRALERMKAKEVLKSPVTGQPMEQISLHGVIVDRCTQSGGVWLDAKELEQLIKKSSASPASGNIITQVFTDLFKKA